VAISQSGETADTLAGLREAKAKGAVSVSICNVVSSTIARESDGVIYTHAGPEIGVASTKAFTTQLAALYLLGLYLAQVRRTLPAARIADYLRELGEIPKKIEAALDRGDRPEVQGRPRLPLPGPGGFLPDRPGGGLEA
jgi:glucosamine--fructose-6-phosphate aminotransferase (isomerizing)